MTSLTMSAGSKEKLQAAHALGHLLVRRSPPARSFCASQSPRRRGNCSRSRCFSSSTRTPLPGLRATRSTASSGPRVHR